MGVVPRIATWQKLHYVSGVLIVLRFSYDRVLKTPDKKMAENPLKEPD